MYTLADTLRLENSPSETGSSEFPFPETPCNQEAGLPSAVDAAGWWDVHTHRTDSDWRYAIRSVGWQEVATLPHYLSASIHPWHLTEEDFPMQWQWLLEAVQDERVVAIGEAGLDKAVGVPFDLQWSAFRRVAALADECRLPLLIHAVRAFNEILELKKHMRPHVPWIIHGFRGKKELAQACLRQGICLSFGEHYQAEALRSVPLESLFLETDESKVDIRELYARAAVLLGLPVENLREKIERNINKLFFRQ